MSILFFSRDWLGRKSEQTKIAEPKNAEPKLLREPACLSARDSEKVQTLPTCQSPKKSCHSGEYVYENIWNDMTLYENSTRVMHRNNLRYCLLCSLASPRKETAQGWLSCLFSVVARLELVLFYAEKKKENCGGWKPTEMAPLKKRSLTMTPPVSKDAVRCI